MIRRVQLAGTPMPGLRAASSPLLALYSECHKEIGTRLQDILPPGWSKVWILVEMRDGNDMITGDFVRDRSTGAPPVSRILNLSLG